MENLKQYINKKTIIIGIVLIAVIALLLILLSVKGTKEKQITCNLSVSQDFYDVFDITIDANYEDKITKEIVEMKVKPNSELIEYFDDLYDDVEKYYETLNQASCASIKVNKDLASHMIMVNYQIDLSKCTEQDESIIKSFSFNSTDAPSLEITKEEFIDSIEKSGGVCSEK